MTIAEILIYAFLLVFVGWNLWLVHKGWGRWK